MKRDETAATEPERAIVSQDDPFGIRKVVLGGDIPTLSSEAKFLSRHGNSEQSRNGERETQDDEPGSTG